MTRSLRFVLLALIAFSALSLIAASYAEVDAEADAEIELEGTPVVAVGNPADLTSYNSTQLTEAAMSAGISISEWQVYAARKIAQRRKECMTARWQKREAAKGTGEAPKATSVMASRLCTGLHRGNDDSQLDASVYEPQAVIADYMVYANSFGNCSAVSMIATKYDVMSSLQARLHCDLYEGKSGPKCLSYVWDMKKGEVHLCAGLPQKQMEVYADVETAWQRPVTCEQISNRFLVSANETWGNANDDIKRVYLEMQCYTKPTPCQDLSNFYALSPKITPYAVARVPGSIRDLWLHQKCATSPRGVAIDRQKPAYQRILSNIQSIEERVAEVDDILTRGQLAKSKVRLQAIQQEVSEARKGLQATLNTLQAQDV